MNKQNYTRLTVTDVPWDELDSLLDPHPDPHLGNPFADGLTLRRPSSSEFEFDKHDDYVVVDLFSGKAYPLGELAVGYPLVWVRHDFGRAGLPRTPAAVEEYSNRTFRAVLEGVPERSIVNVWLCHHEVADWAVTHTVAAEAVLLRSEWIKLFREREVSRPRRHGGVFY